MLSTVPDPACATRPVASPGAGTPAGTVVARVADLRFRGEGTVLAGGPAPRSGELALFCRPVVTAPAVVRRDGTVLADAWLPDLVRLGELEAHLGDGVIEEAVDAALDAGRLPPRQRRRIMSYPLVIRLMIAMTLMPRASYCEALSALAGLLADVPLTREWHVPTEKVVTDWRLPVPPPLTEALFWQAAGPLISDDAPSAVTLAGMPVAGADGMLVNLADTPANRAFFGTTGTADDSSPFPQLRVVALVARAGRAMLGAVLGQARAGEQTLLKRLVEAAAGAVRRARRLLRPQLPRPRPRHRDPGRGRARHRAGEGGHRPALRRRPRPRLAARRVPHDLAERPIGAEGRPAPGPRRRAQRGLPRRRRERGRLGDLHGRHHPPGPRGRPPLTRCGTPTSPGGARARPRSGEDKATITGAGNRTSGPVLRSGRPGWSSRKPGPG